MKRFTALVLLTSGLVAAAAVAGDPNKGKPDEGVAAQKDPAPKEKGKAKGKKEGKDGKEDDADEAKKTKELVSRIARGMEQSGKRLSEKDPREVTQQIQRDVVKNIDELIEKLKKDNEDKQGGGGGGGGGAADKQAGNKGGQGGGDAKANNQGGGGAKSQAKNGGQGKQQAGGQGKGKGGGRGKQQAQGKGKGQGGGQGKKQEKGGQLGSNKKGKGKDGGLGTAKTDKLRHNPLANVSPGRGIWGELPQIGRRQMDAFGQELPLARYERLLEQYSEALAELERRANK
jgi:hypothetical protein